MNDATNKQEQEQDATAAAAEVARNQFNDDVNQASESISTVAKQMLKDGICSAPTLALALALVMADIAAALVAETAGSAEMLDGLISNIERDVVERSRHSFGYYSEVIAARVAAAAAGGPQHNHSIPL